MQDLSKQLPGQFFTTKDAEEFSECGSHVACREYTLPRDDESSTPKGWIRGVTKIGSVLEMVTNYHQGNPGVEIRIDSFSGDGSQSWVRISNELNTFARESTEKTRTFGDDENNSASTGQPVAKEFTIVEHSGAIADKSAAKAKPKPTSSPLSSPSPTGIPIPERNRIEIEPQGHKQRDAQSFPISKRMLALLTHGTLPRDEDGAIEFWSLKAEFRSAFPNSLYWSCGQTICKRRGDIRRDFSFVLILIGPKFFTSELS